MTEPQQPKRAFELRITIGADDWRTLVNELQDLVNHIEEHGTVCNSVSGGCSSNHIVAITQDPTMTNERYMVELHKYLDWRKS